MKKHNSKAETNLKKESEKMRKKTDNKNCE